MLTRACAVFLFLLGVLALLQQPTIPAHVIKGARAQAIQCNGVVGPQFAQSFGGAGCPTSGGGGCSPGTAATNYLARTSGLSGTETTAYCNMINGLVTDGVITGNLGGAASCGSTLDLFYIFATNTTTTANLNICGTSFPLTKQNSVAFSADHGYTGDGSTGYFTTPFSAGNCGQNSCSAGAYVLSSRTTGGSGTAVGTTNSAQYTYVGPCGTSCAFSYEVNGFTFNGDAESNAQGFWIATRPNSTTVAGYRNGTLTASHTDPSIGSPNSAFYVLCYNNGGSCNSGSYDPDQVSAVFVGDDTTSFVSSLSNRINAYMTALGINVY